MSNKKPSGPKSAYVFYSQDLREEHKKENPDVKTSFTEFSKIASEKWKTISGKEKSKYFDMAAEDKKRYLKEMESYEPDTKSKKASKKSKREAKDPNKPKNAWSAFFFFSDEHRKSIKEKNPDFKVGDIAKVLGKMWNECKDRSKYEELSKKDKERYNAAMVEYKKGAPPAKKSKTTVATNDAEVEEEEEEEYESEEEE